MEKVNFKGYSDFADRGWMLSEIGDWVEARKYFRKAIDCLNEEFALTPPDAKSLNYSLRGNLKYELEDYEGAINDLNKFLHIDQNKEDLDLTYYLKAKCNYAIGNIKKAIKDISKSINYFPNDYIFWGFRGFCHMDIKQYRKALDDFSEAIKINPEDLKSRELIKECITEFTRQLPI